VKNIYLLIPNRFVWILPTYSGNSDGALSGVQVSIQDSQDESHLDLAAGAGGAFRYVNLSRDGQRKITELRLLRRSEKVDWGDIRKLNFDGWSGDINDGRGGEFLHFVWKC
jgi:hypothetical protein